MKEIWKDIKEFEGFYQCSNLGHIRSVDRIIIRKNGIPQKTKGCIIKPRKNKNGYMQLSLWKDNKRKMVYVHKIVATEFVDNPMNLGYINHIDGDTTNNIATNLEWCTSSDNLQHSYDKLDRPVNKQGAKKRCVKAFDITGNFVYQFESIAETSRKIKLGESQIRRIINTDKLTKGGLRLVG